MNKIRVTALHDLSSNRGSPRQDRAMGDEKRSRQLCGGVERKGEDFMEEATLTEH